MLAAILIFTIMITTTAVDVPLYVGLQSIFIRHLSAPYLDTMSHFLTGSAGHALFLD